jgi:hypothetical protein
VSGCGALTVGSTFRTSNLPQLYDMTTLQAIPSSA